MNVPGLAGLPSSAHGVKPTFLSSQIALAVLEVTLDRPCTSRQAAQYTQNYGVSATATTTTISRLWKAGYLARTVPQIGAPYVASPKGKSLLRCIRTGLRPHDARVLVLLSRDPLSKAELCVALPDLSNQHLAGRLDILIGMGLVERLRRGYYVLTDLGEFAQPDAHVLIQFLEESP